MECTVTLHFLSKWFSLQLENDSRILSDIALLLDKNNFVFWAFKEQLNVADENLLIPGQISLIVQSLIRAQPC